MKILPVTVLLLFSYVLGGPVQESQSNKGGSDNYSSSIEYSVVAKLSFEDHRERTGLCAWCQISGKVGDKDFASSERQCVKQ